MEIPRLLELEVRERPDPSTTALMHTAITVYKGLITPAKLASLREGNTEDSLYFAGHGRFAVNPDTEVPADPAPGQIISLEGMVESGQRVHIQVHGEGRLKRLGRTAFSDRPPVFRARIKFFEQPREITL